MMNVLQKQTSLKKNQGLKNKLWESQEESSGGDDEHYGNDGFSGSDHEDPNNQFIKLETSVTSKNYTKSNNTPGDPSHELKKIKKVPPRKYGNRKKKNTEESFDQSLINNRSILDKTNNDQSFVEGNSHFDQTQSIIKDGDNIHSKNSIGLSKHKGESNKNSTKKKSPKNKNKKIIDADDIESIPKGDQKEVAKKEDPPIIPSMDNDEYDKNMFKVDHVQVAEHVYSKFNKEKKNPFAIDQDQLNPINDFGEEYDPDEIDQKDEKQNELIDKYRYQYVPEISGSTGRLGDFWSES